MGLQLLGLGFTFGGKDAGLAPMLGQITSQLTGITTSLDTIGQKAADSTTPLSNLAQSLANAPMESPGLADMVKTLGSDLPDAARDSAGVMHSAMGEGASSAFGLEAALGFLSGGLTATAGLFAGAAVAAGGFLTALVPPSPRALLEHLHGLQAGMNLTTGLESTMQGLGVTARQMGANFGYTGTDLAHFSSQAASLAQGLNVGADEAARALRAVSEAGDEFHSMGLDSAADVARFTAGFGVNADLLRNSAMQMTREFGLTGEQIGGVMSSVAAFGQTSGDVAGAFGVLPQMMEEMRTRAAGMGATLDADTLSNFARQSMGLAAGLFAIGQDSDTARAAALELSTALANSQQNFQNLFSGTASEMDSFVSELAISTGDVGTAFDMMRSGPQGFVEGMTSMVQGMDRTSPQFGQRIEFIRARLSAVLGPEAGNRLADFFRNATDGALASMSGVRDATRDLGAMGAEAHRTGRTMEENFTLMREQAEMSFRAISRHEAGDFMVRSREAMRDVTRGMRAVHDAGGPAADILDRMSLADRIGGLAFLPEQLQGTAVAATAMGDQISESVTAFTSLGGIVDMISTGIALFTTQVALNVGEGMTWGQAFERTAQQFSGIAIGLIDDVFGPNGYLFAGLDAFANFDFESVLGGGAAATTGLGGAFRRVFERLSDVDWSGLASRLGQGFQHLWDLIDWDATRTAVRTALTDAWTWVAENVPWGEIGKDMGEGLDAAWTEVRPYVMSGLSALGDWMLAQAPVIGSALFLWLASPALWASASAGVAALMGALGTWLIDAAAVAFVSFAPEMAAIIVGAVEGGAVIEVLGAGLGAVFGGGILEMLAVGLAGIGAAVAGFFTWPVILGIAAVIAIGTLIWYTWGDEISAFFSGLWEDITDYFMETWSGIIGWFTSHFPRMTAAVSAAVASWSGRFERFHTWFSAAWDRAGVRLGVFWNGVSGAVSRTMTTVVGFFSAAWDAIVAAAGPALAALFPVFAQLYEVVMAVIGPITTALGRAWDGFTNGATSLWDTVGPILDQLGAQFITMLLDPLTAIETMWTNFPIAAGVAFNAVVAAVTVPLTALSTLFSSFGSAATGAFTGVMDTVQSLFGHSVNTVVGEDMAATQEVVTQTVDAVAAHLEEVLFGSTVRALTEGFTAAFAAITESGTAFADVMSEQFASLAETISNTMVDLYERIVAGAAISSTGIDTFIGPLIQRLGQLAAAQASVAESRAQITPAVDTSRAERLSTMSVDLQAIHAPDWYYNDYQALFIAKMNQVVSAVGSRGAAASGTEGTAALDAILAALNRTRPPTQTDPIGGSRVPRPR